jgi:hypothetical protein
MESFAPVLFNYKGYGIDFHQEFGFLGNWGIFDYVPIDIIVRAQNDGD